MKKILLLFLFVIFAVNSSALIISSPNAVPASSNWFFSVQFESTEFDKAVVFLGEEKILTLFPSDEGKAAISDSDKIIFSSFSNNNLYVSSKGFPKGEKTIEVVLYSNNAETLRESFDVNFFEAVSFEKVSANKDKISYVYDLVELLSKQISVFESDLSLRDSKIAKLESEIDSLTGLISDSDSRIQSLEKKSSNVSESVSGSSRNFSTNATGFFGFDLGFVFVGVVVFVLIALVVFIFIKDENFNLKPKDTLFSDAFSGFEKKQEIDDDDIEEVSKKKKWSVEEDEFEEDEEEFKEFSAGDLIKKRDRP